jgi:hypothetical protein
MRFHAVCLIPEHESRAHHGFVAAAHFAAQPAQTLQLSCAERHVYISGFNRISAKLRLVILDARELALLADVLDAEIVALTLVAKASAAIEIALHYGAGFVGGLEHLDLDRLETEIADLPEVAGATSDRHRQHVHQRQQIDVISLRTDIANTVIE